MRAWLIAAVVTAAACGGASKEVRAARMSAYHAQSADAVFNEVVAAVAKEYPLVAQVDGQNHRIVTCWRPIERRRELESAGSPGSDVLLYRAIVVVSPEEPYRVSVSGRAGQYRPPEIVPFAHDDADEPGWVSGRTDRLLLQIHDRMKGAAYQVAQAAPAAPDPGEPMNVDQTCIMRANEYGIPLIYQGIVLTPKTGP